MDAGLRMDGIPAVELWDLVIDVLHPTKQKKRLTSEGMTLEEIHHVSPNAKQFRHTALLYIFEDSEAVIKMIVEGRGPTMRQVPQPQS